MQSWLARVQEIVGRIGSCCFRCGEFRCFRGVDRSFSPRMDQCSEKGCRSWESTEKTRSKVQRSERQGMEGNPRVLKEWGLGVGGDRM